MEVQYPPPPPQKGYLSDTCAIPYENKENACDTPLCDTISKGYCAIWGCISHWASKGRGLDAQIAGDLGIQPASVVTHAAPKIHKLFNQDAFNHDKGQKSAISGRRLHWIF